MPLDAHASVALASPTARANGCGSRHGPRWHVAQTHQQAERQALSELTRQGYTGYLPLCLVRVRDRALRTLSHTVERPLFSGYLFIRFDANADTWRPICSTRGIRRLFMTGSQIPIPVADAAVEALRAGETLRRTPATRDALYGPGTPCEAILGGGLKVNAVVVSRKGDKAVIAALMFGALREMVVTLDKLGLRDEA
jgi:transcriptional antiterminator RfaH